MSLPKYNRYPETDVANLGYVKQISDLINLIKKNNYQKIVIETYPGVDLKVLKKTLLLPLAKNYQLFWSEDYALNGIEFQKAIHDDLSNDRVFGQLSQKSYQDFFTKKITNMASKSIVYGIGAHYLVAKADLIIYVDLPRWEIQLRYREGKRVFFGGTLEKEVTQNFKRGYFVEWRMADKIKKYLLPKADFYIDATNDNLKVITNKQFFACLKQIAKQPFRLVPYFDAGVWGGTWMQKHFDLPKNKKGNWAWGFDGVPEENSLRFGFTNDYIEMPAINLVFFEAPNLLGSFVEKRFGKEFPIRFDFLDTIGGQNLSLQVHPTTKYIQEKFKMPYTQEESYYILDVDQEAKPVCYLGFKNKIKAEDFISDLKKAQITNQMDVNKYVNQIPVQKHDHLLHPAGVIHSSGKGTMVLEISATPYIFTFKLWDWARLDLNGKPRPINIEHGKKVLDYTFDNNKTKKELVNNFQIINQNENYEEVATGLHQKQFIETRRFLFKSKQGILVNNHNSVNMLNLVSGQKIIVRSVDHSFADLTIAYAETFIVPASCQKYYLIPHPENDKTKIMVIQSFVRKNS